MLTISRTSTPQDYFMDYTANTPFAQSMPTKPVDLATPKSTQGPFAPRLLESTSSRDSDPFLDMFLPWEALFQSNIWVPSSPSELQAVPTDISRTNSRADSTSSTLAAELDMTDLSRLLDPTSIEFGFRHSCLIGLDEKVLLSPLEAFASVCWETAATSNYLEEQDSLCELTSILELDEEPSSPSFIDGIHPIPVPISASLLWSDDSDSDSDECRTYRDDYTPIATIHDNGAITALHPVGDFLPIEKEKGLFYRDLTMSFGTFQPVFPLSEQKESIGQSPIPIIPLQNKSVSKRIAAFYHARFPSRLTAPIVR